MRIQQLIECLSDPWPYPHPVDRVEVRQTHISVVFLAGEFVYKIRKPVDLGFLDFTTLDRRHRDCLEEVRLNRRLAPDVYLGVVGIAESADGVRFAEGDPVVEWAVKMRRLPDHSTLLEYLQRGELSAAQVENLARVVAEFHRRADGGEAVAACGRLDVVARNARENFAQAEQEVGTTASRRVFDRVRDVTEQHLRALGPLIEARSARGVPRDTHGDLHLDHVYLFPDRPPPGDVVAIDCIEFNERFRFADPVADMAFLVMDLKFRGRRDLARAFAEAYFEHAQDRDGRELLPFYTAYRAVVRAKVEGLTLREPEVPAGDKEANRRLAQAHWLLALSELESAGRRPALVLIGGLPGTGKSSLACELAPFGFSVVRSDVVRKELYPGVPAPSPPGAGLYSPEVSATVYAECLRRTEEHLLNGGRVIVDANFRDEPSRVPFLDLSERLTVPVLFVVCEAAPEVVQERLATRRGDASDADWSVYQWAVQKWVNPGTRWQDRVLRVATDAPPTPAAEEVRARLRADGLLDIGSGELT